MKCGAPLHGRQGRFDASAEVVAGARHASPMSSEISWRSFGPVGEPSPAQFALSFNGVDEYIENAERCPLVDDPTEYVATKHERRELETGLAEPSVSHGKTRA